MKKILLLFILIPFYSYTQNPVSGINMLKNSKWPSESSGKTIIEVSWENPTNSNKLERKWVREAIEESWESYANIDFIGWGKSTYSSKGIRIVINNYGHPHAKGLGTQIDGVVNGVELNFEFLGNFPCTMSREDCIKFIAVHEFGHAIGLAHEHNRPDCLCGEKPQGTDGGFYVTPCDINSVMNYCNPKWSNYGKLSKLDIEGIQKIYGKPGMYTNIVELDEIRFVPCRNDNRSKLRSIRSWISQSDEYSIKYFTEEGEEVPQPAVDNLPNIFTIRYFHPDDAAKALDLKNFLITSGLSRSQITIENMLPKMKKTYPKYIEIWYN